MNRFLSTTTMVTLLALSFAGCSPSSSKNGPRTGPTAIDGAGPSKSADPGDPTSADSKVSESAIAAAIQASGPGFDSGGTNPGATANPGAASRPAQPSNGFAGTVTETMDASSYTYVKVTDGEKSIWAATLRFDVAVGERVVVPMVPPMQNFHSSALGRTFETIYFCNAIAQPDRPSGAGRSARPGPVSTAEPTPTPAADSGPTVPKAEGGLTIAEVFADPKARVGQEVTVRGRVVKYNSAILGRNWLHIRDGSGSTGTNDLTVTTTNSARVGDTVLIRGVVAVDKDFGAGYRYPLIIENAKVTVE